MTLRADWATGDLVSKNNKQLKIGGGNIARWIERFPSANAQSLELDTQHCGKQVTWQMSIISALRTQRSRSSRSALTISKL